MCIALCVYEQVCVCVCICMGVGVGVSLEQFKVMVKYSNSITIDWLSAPVITPMTVGHTITLTCHL